MTQEKVIKALECCMADKCRDCPNNGKCGECFATISVTVLHDILSVLKSQTETMLRNSNDVCIQCKKRMKEHQFIDLAKLLSDFVLRINSMTDAELDASCKQAEEDSQDSQDYY